ncbi:MAG: sulfotransferase [Pseudomonadota bacterium]
MSGETPRHGHIDSYRYVFLLTYGRSGSTLLNRVLNAIPGYLIRGENQNALFALHRYLASLHSARFDFIRRDQGPDHPWYGANGIRYKRIEAECLTGFVRHVLRPEADSAVLGFKEIRHTSWDMPDAEFAGYVAFLLERFPGARIIFNSRNWQDVARSDWWANVPPERVRELVGSADARFHSACAAWPGRTLALRYEGFSADAEGFRPLFDFLGAEFDPDRLRPILKKRLTHTTDRAKTGPAPSPPGTAPRAAARKAQPQ